MSMQSAKLTNLQLELLRMFSRELSPKQLLEVKQLLVTYFANQVSDQMDALWEERGWTEETMELWTNEHMRTPYSPES
ncbi:MAG: hypothetical protein AAF399_06350 [Bacteroidota bacterium]